MATLNRAQAAIILYRLGWRVNTSARLSRAIINFQAGWNLGTALSVDGKVGPKTSAALLLSEKRRKAGLGTASAHFSFEEVRCRCGGKYASCWRIWQKRSAFVMMEKYRASAGAFRPVSGCRCPSHNKAVKGSPTSRHPLGLACDVPPRKTVAQVRALRCATHIGYSPSLGKVIHLDVGAGGSTSRPVVYKDGR